MKATCLIVLVYALCGLASATVLAAAHRNVDPLDVVRQKFVAFDKHDVSGIEKIYAVDAILHSPDYPALAGGAPIADTYRRLFEAIPDAKDNLESLDRVGDKIYAQFVLTGHFKGANDKAISVRIMSVYTVRDGHIVADSTYYDRKSQ